MMKKPVWVLPLIFISLGSCAAFALDGTIIDHRVIETTEIDGTKVPGKIEMSSEECQALATGQDYSQGTIMIMDQPLSEAEISVQESLTGRRVIRRKVSVCLAR